MRGTFTHHNLDFSQDVLHLADLGFQQISVEPVVAAPEEGYALRAEDLPQLFAEYDRLAVEVIRRQREGRPFQFFHFMIDLEGGPCVAKRLSGCGSGTEYLAVTPWGDLYPCHQFVGSEPFLMGNVADGVTNVQLQKEFKQCNVYAKEKCRDCFARFYCSGGCAANSYHFHGRWAMGSGSRNNKERKNHEEKQSSGDFGLDPGHYGWHVLVCRNHYLNSWRR